MNRRSFLRAAVAAPVLAAVRPETQAALEPSKSVNVSVEIDGKEVARLLDKFFEPMPWPNLYRGGPGNWRQEARKVHGGR